MATLSQAQVEQWIAQNGGPSALQYGVEKKQVRNPEYDPATNPLAPQYVDIEVEVWKNGKTDAMLSVRRLPDGNLEQIENIGANPNKPAERTSDKPTIGRVEGTPMPDGTFDNTKPIWVERDPVTQQQVGPAKQLNAQQREDWEREKNGGKTDAQVRAESEEASSQDAVPNRPGWVKITRKKGNDTKTVYRGPDGKEVESLPEEVKTGTKQFVHTDGKTYFEVTKTEGGVTSVYVTDSAGNRVTLPGKESKSITQKRAPNGTVYYEVSVEKDGRKETYTASDPEGNTRIPPPGQSPMEGVTDIPPFTPDLTKPGGGLVERAEQLNGLMKAGKIKTWEQRQAILAEDIKTANVVAGEFNTASTLLREDYQQRTSQRSGDITQAGNRATLANTHHQNAVALIEKFAPYLGATPGDAGKLFLGMMASQLATATAYGGMKDVPREDMDPRLRQWAENTLGRSLAPTSVPPGPGEASAPVAAGVAATNAAAANPTGANVQAATDATMQGSQAAFGALGLPPVQPDPRAVEAAFRATGQPLPAPAFRPTPLTSAVPSTPDQSGQPASFIDNTVWQQAPQPVGMAPLDTQNMANGEALFGKTLPQPQSWRQDAQDQAFALTMPQPQAYGTGAGLFGGSLPLALTQPAGGMDFNLNPPQGGGMDPIDAEARRQLQAEGVLV